MQNIKISNLIWVLLNEISSMLRAFRRAIRKQKWLMVLLVLKNKENIKPVEAQISLVIILKIQTLEVRF